jgi:hypothetical protein
MPKKIKDDGVIKRDHAWGIRVLISPETVRFFDKAGYHTISCTGSA